MGFGRGQRRETHQQDDEVLVEGLDEVVVRLRQLGLLHLHLQLVQAREYLALAQDGEAVRAVRHDHGCRLPLGRAAFASRRAHPTSSVALSLALSHFLAVVLRF